MRIKRPDSKNALSLLESSAKKMRYTLTLSLTDDSASTIASNVYECFRMLGDALFVHMGVMQTDHKEVIDELCKLDVEAKRPIAVIKNLRQLRHNIHYYGYEPRLAEVQDVIVIAQVCFEPLLEEVKEIVSE